MKLSKNFFLYEFENSETAEKNGINNTVPEIYIPAIMNLTIKILQPLRDELGQIDINSGYRSLTLNRFLPGSSKTSQHMIGEAADISSLHHSARKIFDTIIKLKLPFDQLIFEKRGDIEWVHVSLKLNGTNRFQILEIVR